MQVFPIAAPSSLPIWFSILITLFLLGLIAFIFSLGFLGRKTTFSLSDTELVISGWPYGRTVALDELDIDSAKLTNLSTSVYKPRFRTNGIGLPGYKLGWFRLANGERALLFVTDPENVIYVKTKDDYSLLLSPSNPEEMLSSLQGKS